MSRPCELGPRCVYSFYDDRNHIRLDGKILGTVGQFCGAFFHVPQTFSNRQQIHFTCLDKECIIMKYIESNRQQRNPPRNNTPPKTAVALVKYETDANEILFLKRYTNCYSGKMHAEEFFCLDINSKTSEHRELITAMYDEKRITKITMYITMQPCHRSTAPTTKGTHDDQSCCKMIFDAIRYWHNQVKNDVKILIKPTHLSRAGGTADDDLTRNANDGLGALMSIPNIEVLPMGPRDWKFLLEHSEVRTQQEMTLQTNIDEYFESLIGDYRPRRLLDAYIDEKLRNICKEYAPGNPQLQPENPQFDVFTAAEKVLLRHGACNTHSRLTASQ